MPARIAVVVACTLSILGGIARGDDDREKRLRAAAHYEAGAEAFEKGDYDAAVREYVAAHEIAPSNALLYNIARAYHLGGDGERALEYYQLYLKLEPDGKVAHEAEVFAEELREEIGDRPLPEEEPPEEPQEVPEEPAAAPLEVEGRAEADSGGLSTGTWIAIAAFGAAGIAAGVSVKFGLDARRRKRNLENWDQQWPDNLKTRIDRQERDATIFGASAVAAGVLAAVGTTLLLWPDGNTERRSTSVSVSPGAALLTTSVRF